MKILHINSYYYGSLFYKGLFDKQLEDGLDLDVYTPVPKSKPVSNFVYGDYTRICKNHGKYDRILFHVKHKKIYGDIIRQYDISNFDLIHAHSLFSNGYIALKLKEKYKIPYVVAVRSTDAKIFFKRMIHLRKLGIRILEQAQTIIFLSRTNRDRVIEGYVPERLRQMLLDKTVIIPNGIDDFWFENIGAHKFKPNTDELKLVYAGQINKNKNPIGTIQAIKILQEKGYHVKFAVAGAIGDQRVFREMTRHSFVTYLGMKTKEELIGIYRQNDIFIMPSKMETFGLVYAEAMSQGTPVLYTKGEGFDGQFEDGIVGYSVDCMNPAVIAERILDIVNEYETISQNCILNCRKFNWRRISDEYGKLYELEKEIQEEQ